MNVAFTSSATDLVDPNVHTSSGQPQVYVRSLTLPSPSTELVSVGTDGKGTGQRRAESYKNWNLGVQIGNTMHILPIRVS